MRNRTTLTAMNGRNPVPELTTEQRMEYLERAKEARRRRSTVLDNVRAGSLDISDVFAMADAGDVDVRRTRVFTLLRCVPGWGFAKAQRLLRQMGISESRRVQGLGHNQRTGILEAVRRSAR